MRKFLIGLLIAATTTVMAASQGAPPPNNTGVITGTVTSSRGPEAGVWVIAETDDLGTKLRKMVVTNDEGKFLLPELPQANFRVWVRGYGLVDSAPVTSKPEQDLKLTATIARTPQEAAAVYPANYWSSLIEVPSPTTFSRTDGKPWQHQSYGEFLDNLKECTHCHQLGTKATRVIPDRDKFPSTVAAWANRVNFGQRSASMRNTITAMGGADAFGMFASWTDRIAGGETPAAPPRPSGIERNVVITTWDWGSKYSFLHDVMSSDRRNPRVNANGSIFGTDYLNDKVARVDPIRHTAGFEEVPLLPGEDRAQVPQRFPAIYKSRPYGSTVMRDGKSAPHSGYIDGLGRVWITQTARRWDTPAWCKEGSDNKFAKYFPQDKAERHAGFYDPKTDKITPIETCFMTHHVVFGEDANDTAFFTPNTSGPVVGWIQTKVFDQTHDAQRSQGWCPVVIDTNGDGKITKPWNDPEGAGRGKPLDLKLDTRYNAGTYGAVTDPNDGAYWGATTGPYPGRIMRLQLGNNPPETCISEIYEAPSELQNRSVESGQATFLPRGLDIDRNGVVWVGMAGTAQFASFDRRKCAVRNGPSAAQGRHCPEGWKLYTAPGPAFKNSNVKTDFFYLNWTDQFNTLGLGNNIPIATGTNSDSLLALMPDTGQWITMRVPYPLGFHARNMDGRIDDPNAGWKGRAVYAANGSEAPWHTETGPEAPVFVAKFQIRPDPLAR